MAFQATALVVSIVLILGGAYKRIPDYITLGLASIVIGAAMRWSPGIIALTMWKAIISPETLKLAACVGLIRMLGCILQRFGILGTMADSLRRVLKSAEYAVMAVPALLGSLSAFGGAIMSAPLVDGTGDHLEFSPARKAAINILFRHSVFFVYPFSTTLLFTSAIAGVSVFDMVKILWPLSVLMFGASYLLLVRGTKEKIEPSTVPYSVALRQFVVSSSPVWLAILLTSAFGVPLVIALSVGVVLAMAMSRGRQGFAIDALWKSIDFCSITTVLGIMVFKSFVLEMDILPVAMDSLSKRGVPLEVLAAAGIFTFAFISGSLQTGIAVTLPILLSMSPGPDRVLLHASFAYMIGFSSYLVSPLHLCQVLTAKYFNVPLSSIYREYWPVPAATFFGSIALYLVHRAML